MSWFSKNYEKAALGGAVVVALGLAYAGYSKYSGAEKDFSAALRGTGKENTAVAEAERIPQAIASMKIDRKIEQALDRDRPVDLFTGIPLFVASADPERPIDLYRDAAVHPPITNGWWIKNRIDPGFADSPNRDPDQDGFSNLEEFTLETDPNDPKSFPPLLPKLMFVKDESITWVLRPGYGGEGKFPFTYEDSKGEKNKTSAANPPGEGSLFFEEGAMKNRFKLLGAEDRRQMNERINLEVNITIVRIADQLPNKQGIVYEIPSPLPEQRKNEFLNYDRTAVFSLEALGLSGKEFKVKENTLFSLPPDGPKKEYLAKTVTPEKVTVEYTDSTGTVKTIEISKGALPKMGD